MRVFAFNQCEHNPVMHCGKKILAFFSAEFQRLLADMSRASFDTSSSSSDNTAESDADACTEQTRRALLMSALATTACLACSTQVHAGEDAPGSDERPQKGDLLVF